MKRWHFSWAYETFSRFLVGQHQRVEGPVTPYTRSIHNYLTKQLEMNTQTVILENVLPSIAFRECCPLRNSSRSEETAHLIGVAEHTEPHPLQPYLLPDQQLTVPRKSEMELAKWLAACFFNYSNADPRVPLNVIVWGDSQTDLDLAHNFASITSPRLRVACNIMNKSLGVTPRANLTSKITRNWEEWESETEGLLAEIGKRRRGRRPQKVKFVVCDIDKTLIMPEGHAASESALQELRALAYAALLKRLFVREIAPDEARRLYDQSKNFPPYTVGTARGNEDVRAVGAVLLSLDLVPAGSWDNPQQGDLSDYLEKAIHEAKRKNTAGQSANIIYQLYERATKGVPTILEEYRECEHESFLRLQGQGQYFFNGRVLRCLRSACDRGWIPVGYSDRPGASVGLRVDAHHLTAWPVIPDALISLSGNIVLPD